MPDIREWWLHCCFPQANKYWIWWKWFAVIIDESAYWQCSLSTFVEIQMVPALKLFWRSALNMSDLKLSWLDNKVAVRPYEYGCYLLADPPNPRFLIFAIDPYPCRSRPTSDTSSHMPNISKKISLKDGWFQASYSIMILYITGSSSLVLVSRKFWWGLIVSDKLLLLYNLGLSRRMESVWLHRI